MLALVGNRMMRILLLVLFTAVLASSTIGPAVAGIGVVVTIKPVHALVAAIMHGVAEPRLLVRGSASPHTYALVPSDVEAIEKASIFVRVSPAIEPFTAKIITALPTNVRVVSVMDAPGLKLFATRRGPLFDSAHGSSTDASGGIDPHAWLDPANASAMVAYIANVLARSDPANAAAYRTNAMALQARLGALAIELDSALGPVANRPYVVFHDGMQYFERRFGLNAIGSIFTSPEIPPSAKRLIALRNKISVAGAVCAFAEPRFNMALVTTVIENTGLRVGTLDPEAITISPGPELYFTLMRSLAADLTRCLATRA
jgi:zinc transport system substrate-binding protein